MIGRAVTMSAISTAAPLTTTARAAAPMMAATWPLPSSTTTRAGLMNVGTG